jgi:hypothetical protein
VNTRIFFKLFSRFGWLVIIVSSLLGLLIISNIISDIMIPIEIIFIPIGIGFLFLVPWSYIEADKMRKQMGQISYTYLSYVGKYLFFGLISLFVFFLMR